jgi:hypothetical protein
VSDKLLKDSWQSACLQSYHSYSHRCQRVNDVREVHIHTLHACSQQQQCRRQILATQALESQHLEDCCCLKESKVPSGRQLGHVNHCYGSSKQRHSPMTSL